tara:strand:- start:276 stop:494 length:219 start_codon:yes stop_codon:yes gene_type:complete
MEIGTLVQIDTFSNTIKLAIVVDKCYSNREFDPDLKGYVYKFKYLDDGMVVSFMDKIVKAYVKSGVIQILGE